MSEIEKLKQENAKLKAKIKKYAELNEIDTRDYAALHNENKKLNAIIDGYQPRLQKYKEILQEIREYAESIGNEEMINGYAIRAKSALWQIANKITKAEEEWKY